MSENQPDTPPPAAEQPKTVIVNDPIDPPSPEAMSAAVQQAAKERAAGVMRRGFGTGVPTRTARESVSFNTALRRAGVNVAGLHKVNERGQYDAAGKLGPNDPCECNWAAETPHKFKRHAKVAGPLIRASLDKALAEAQAKVTQVPMEKVEPTVRGD